MPGKSIFPLPYFKASRPGPEAAKHLQTITLPPLDRWYEVLTVECSVWFSPDNGTHLAQEVDSSLPESTWKHLDDHQYSLKNVLWTNESKV